MTYKDFDHLQKNLHRVSKDKAHSNSSLYRKAWIGSSSQTLDDWLQQLLPNTRLILEPKIDGISVEFFYGGGAFSQAITKNGNDISSCIPIIQNIPLSLPINNPIQLRGEIYDLDISDFNLEFCSERDEKLITYFDECSFYVI